MGELPAPKTQIVYEDYAEEFKKRESLEYRAATLEIALKDAGTREKILLERIDLLEIIEARYEDALQQIDNWAKAYPLDLLPEPDLKRVGEVLSEAGLSLSQVSASAMRHVISGIAKIAAGALKGGEE